MNVSTIVRLVGSLKSGFGLPVLIFVCGLASVKPPVCAAELLRLDIGRTNSNVVLTWTNQSVALETTLVVTGAWIELTGAISPVLLAPSNVASFFRLRGTLSPTVFDFRYVAPTFTTSIGDPFGCGCTSPENPNSLAAAGSAQDNGMGSALLHTGELTQHTVDLAIPGRGFDWRFTRAYRSGMSYDGPMGHGWDFNYNRRLVAETNGNVLCVDGLGRVDRYTLNTNGTFNSPGGIYARLTRNLDGTFEERDRHGTTNSYAATNTLGVARLTRISDRNANQMTFQYNAVGQLTNVVDTLARSIACRYDANGRLTNVVDFAGRSLRFSYDGNGNLISATSPSVTGTPNGNDFPTGKTTSYTYAIGFGDARFNHNLLSVTAPNEVAVAGPARLVAQYDTNPVSPNADRMVSLRIGGTNASGVGAGGTISYTYASFGPVGSNDFATAVFQNTVTNRNGNRTEYRFNQLGNIVRTIQFTRGLRVGEPLGYTNTFAYNRDGEMIARTNAELDTAEYTFDSANPDRLQQGNLRQVRRLPGPRGGDQAQIVVSNAYEPNYNFVATSTDARGNTITNRYDAKGNRTNTVHRLPSIVEDFEYNTFGQLTAQVLPDNGSAHRRRDVMTYYSTGPQTGYLQSRVVDAGPTNFNLTTTYEYDAVGNVTNSIDARGNNTIYTVNALNQIVRQSSREVSTLSGPVRYQTDTSYDANNNVTRVDVENRDDTGAVVLTNPAFTTTYAYDILDDRLRTTREVDIASNIVTTNAYDANQNLVLAVAGEAVNGNQPNNIVQTLYDERDLAFREIRAPGSAIQSTTQYDYDRNGNSVRTAHGTEDAGGRVTLYAYDGYDRRIVATDAMGNVTTLRYDSNGNTVTNRTDGELNDVPGSAGNIRLSEATYQYDAMDRRLSQDVAHFDTQTQLPIGDGSATTQWIYADNSQVTSRTDDNPGHITFTVYDTAWRQRTVTDARGNSTTYTYDANGNVTQTLETDRSDLANPDQTFTNTFVYDQLDRLTQQTDNIGNTRLFAYDSRDNRLLYTDARSNQTRYVYDGLNRLLQTLRDMDANTVFTDPADIVTLQTWDDSSRPTGQTDDNGNTTAYAYDSLDRRVMTDYADCTTDSIAYDVHDNPVTTTDANGSVVTNTYDLLNRVTNKAIAPGPGVSSATTFEKYQYDGLSRLIRAEDNDSLVTRGSASTSGYNSLSRVLRETQRVIPGGLTRSVTNEYDSEGNQTRLVYPGGRAIIRIYDLLDRPLLVNDDPPAGPPIATYAYIGPYRVEQRSYPKLNPTQSTRFTPSYDGIRRITDTTHSLIGGATFDKRHYDWDGNNNKIHADRSIPAPLEDRFYTYDAANRLILSQVITGGPPSIISYTLDGVGNRTIVSGGPNPGPYTMDPTLCEPGDFQMNQYTTTPLDSRAYNLNGSLTSLTNLGQSLEYDYRNQLVRHVSGVVTTYRYDCFGRRIEKDVGGTITRFYYDGSEEIEEQNAANATVATYVYSKGRHTRLQMSRGGQKYYYHEDDLGSVMKVTDQFGNTAEGCEHKDFGGTLFTDQFGNPILQSAIGNPYLFHSLRFETESGLGRDGNRDLDVHVGQYIQRAELISGGMGNARTFVGHNPVSGMAVTQDGDWGPTRPGWTLRHRGVMRDLINELDPWTGEPLTGPIAVDPTTPGPPAGDGGEAYEIAILKNDIENFKKNQPPGWIDSVNDRIIWINILRTQGIAVYWRVRAEADEIGRLMLLSAVVKTGQGLAGATPAVTVPTPPVLPTPPRGGGGGSTTGGGSGGTTVKGTPTVIEGGGGRVAPPRAPLPSRPDLTSILTDARLADRGGDRSLASKWLWEMIQREGGGVSPERYIKLCDEAATRYGVNMCD